MYIKVAAFTVSKKYINTYHQLTLCQSLKSLHMWVDGPTHNPFFFEAETFPSTEATTRPSNTSATTLTIIPSLSSGSI